MFINKTLLNFSQLIFRSHINTTHLLREDDFKRKTSSESPAPL